MVKGLFVPLLTETAPVGEMAPLVSADAVMVNVEPEVPAWVTVNTLFAMVELALLEDALVLAETEYCTVPLPFPLLPEVMVNQEALLPAVQRHVDWVLTLTVPVPLDWVRLWFGGEMEYVHVLLLTSLEYVLSTFEVS